jgi:predicted acetyltransferase
MNIPPVGDDDVEVRRGAYAGHRLLGAVDDGVLCGSTRTFATSLRVPGGAVPAGAVSSVGVLPTHRRRGALTQMMAAQLAESAEHGEVATVLIAAEWPIYGRYGYGVATDACTVRLDSVTAAFRAPATGSVRLVDAKAFRDAAADVYERQWARSPGHISWEPQLFDVWAGLRELRDGEDEARRQAPKVVWRDAAGQVQGVASYAVSDRWIDNRPRGELRTREFVAATGEAERELFRYLTTVDWASSVVVGLRPVDDPLPLQLVDGRSAVLADRFDHIWLRLIDVPAALGARRYAVEGSLVVEVDDPLGFAGGRFLVEGGPDGASCAPTDRPAELAVPVDVLGSAYLGAQPWGRLAAAGVVEERVAGAVDRASALFTTPRPGWCSTDF